MQIARFEFDEEQEQLDFVQPHNIIQQEPFINKPCVSEQACHEDKMKVLGKIRAEIENHCGLIKEDHCRYCYHCNSVMGIREILEVIDKYKEESEEKNE